MTAKPAIFHEGEIAIQERLGVAEKMDNFGRRVIREYMPQQHQDFYQQLPMVFAGYTDAEQRVWASVLTGEPGFIKVPDDKRLSLSVEPLTGDPLINALHEHSAQAPLKVGLLGIELETRRRNRLSAQVSSLKNGQIEMDVLQAFGNCPQYIQTRSLRYAPPSFVQPKTDVFSEFSSELTTFISNADTFFVASSAKSSDAELNDDVTQGADVSHRGGRQGFVRVDDATTLTIPDYMGNNHFNTLGNFVVNPSAGLLFIDFETGDVITMTGTAKILWDHADQTHFKGAERLWQFKLEQGYILRGAMPYRFQLETWSPNSLMTGSWPEANELAKQHALENEWLCWTVDKIVDESAGIKSFYFRTESGITPSFKAGQFLTVRANFAGKQVSRNYSVSSSPFDDFIRISVKRDGMFSTWLHDRVLSGDKLDVKLPRGGFFLDDSSDKPVVFLSAGVGITPMVSMMRYLLQDGLRTRRTRPAIMINTFREQADQAFFNEINQLLKQGNHNSNAYWLLTAPEDDVKPGVDYSGKWRINKDVLQAVLSIGRYDFYLCGPGGFMQDTYDLLIELGVPDEDIKAEAFGPASLTRITTVAKDSDAKPEAPVADAAVITFKRAGVEQVWQPSDGNLLDFAESHGLEPEFGCRGGSCGSCKVKIAQGEVVHSATASFPVESDEALLCCAMPKASKEDDIASVVIDL